MKNSIIPFLATLFVTSSLWAKPSIRTEILDLLPKELSTLTPNDSRKDIEMKLSSKISKKDKPEALYLNYFDQTNDVSIGTESGKFSYLYVEIPQSIAVEKENLYSSILGQLTSEQKKKIAEENEKKISHEKGRFIIIDLPEEGLKLEFSNNEKKSLHSVIVFPKENK